MYVVYKIKYSPKKNRDDSTSSVCDSSNDQGVCMLHSRVIDREDQGALVIRCGWREVEGHTVQALVGLQIV